jgi:transcriptional regulator with XRE-family HTH domain
MSSPGDGQRHCRCGTRLALDNPGPLCAGCQRACRDRFTPPDVPAEFWLTERLMDAFAAQHMGRVAAAYRKHPYHWLVYGDGGISQRLLGQWLGLSQAQVSRIEHGPPVRNLDLLVYWARVLRIPPELLWFKLPGDTGPLVEAAHVATIDPERDPVLTASWSHRGTLEASVALRGGEGQVQRRKFLLLAGAALTAPAHQWLIREPGPVVSGLSGGRVSASLADRLPAMIAELRKMDDVAGGGSVFPLVQHHFGWVAGLLDQASYDERTGCLLHVALAELGLTAGWAAYDVGEQGLAQRYWIAALRAAHSGHDRALGAHILGSMAKQTAHRGRAADAVTLAETALAGARERQTPRLLAELYVRQAFALATLGDASGCTRALSEARTQIEQLEQDDDPPWVYWVTPAFITAESGNCLLQVSQADRAAAMLDEGAAGFDESFPRDRQYYLAHLANALARPGKQRDLETAAARGMEVIALAEGLQSATVGAFHDLYGQMTPHADVPAVREFLERGRTLVS